MGGNFCWHQYPNLCLVVMDMVAALELIAALPNCGPTRVDFWTYRALPVGDYSSLSLDAVAVALVVD